MTKRLESSTTHHGRLAVPDLNQTSWRLGQRDRVIRVATDAGRSAIGPFGSGFHPGLTDLGHLLGISIKSSRAAGFGGNVMSERYESEGCFYVCADSRCACMKHTIDMHVAFVETA